MRTNVVKAFHGKTTHVLKDWTGAIGKVFPVVGIVDDKQIMLIPKAEKHV